LSIEEGGWLRRRRRRPSTGRAFTAGWPMLLGTARATRRQQGHRIRRTSTIATIGEARTDTATDVPGAAILLAALAVGLAEAAMRAAASLTGRAIRIVLGTGYTATSAATRARLAAARTLLTPRRKTDTPAALDTQS